jgi:tight adherence protein C
MNSELGLYAAFAAVALSVGLFTYLAATAEPGGGMRATQRSGRRMESPSLRLLLGMARAFVPIHANAAATPRGRQIERFLKQAGRPLGLTVAEFLSLRYVGAILGVVVGFLFSTQASGEPDFRYILPMGIFGFFYPSLRLKAVIAERHRHVFRDLPYVLDLIVLSMEAGQDLSSALGTVVEQGPPGPLGEEFRITHQEVLLGKSRADALRSMADRMDLPDLTSLVFALIQAEQLGGSVAAVLRIMAEQMRVKRWTLADEAAGKVPVKLMAPLVICIFPASFIVLFVPIYVRNQMAGF